MAVCSGEREYVQRFAEYANRRQASLLTVHGFTDSGELSAYTKEHPVDILLLAEELAGKLSKEKEYGNIILLSGDEYQASSQTEYPVIYKYQSCPQILRQAVEFYSVQTSAAPGRVLRAEKMKCIGIYSPIGRTGKTGFALALGKEIAKKKRTLYLNLEEYSGFADLYPAEGDWTLSELLYFMKQKKQAVGWKLDGMPRSMGGLDYIPPLRSPVEYENIKREDWKALLELLEKESRYEVVILDLSGAVDGWYELLEECSGVYTPVETDETAAAKLRQYEETLKLMEREQILENSKRLELSAYDGLELLVKAEGKRWCEP